MCKIQGKDGLSFRSELFLLDQIPESWWNHGFTIGHKAAETDRYNGDDYSFVHYASHQPLGIDGMINTIAIPEEGRNLIFR